RILCNYAEEHRQIGDPFGWQTYASKTWRYIQHRHLGVNIFGSMLRRGYFQSNHAGGIVGQVVSEQVIACVTSVGTGSILPEPLEFRCHISVHFGDETQGFSFVDRV